MYNAQHIEIHDSLMCNGLEIDSLFFSLLTCRHGGKEPGKLTERPSGFADLLYPPFTKDRIRKPDWKAEIMVIFKSHLK